MMKKGWLISIFFVASLSGLVFSQTASKRRRTTRFSSVYTDLQRNCKSALTKKEEKESEARGQDTPERCKGYGGYHIIVGYTGIGSQQINIAPDSCDVCDNEDIVFLNTHGERVLSTPIASRVEWRLADGKPFAVIVRFGIYRGPTKDEESDYTPFQDKFQAGQLLLVRGLKGYERVDFEVDAKTPDANEKARELADNAFLQGR